MLFQSLYFFCNIFLHENCDWDRACRCVAAPTQTTILKEEKQWSLCNIAEESMNNHFVTLNARVTDASSAYCTSADAAFKKRCEIITTTSHTYSIVSTTSDIHNKPNLRLLNSLISITIQVFCGVYLRNEKGKIPFMTLQRPLLNGLNTARCQPCLPLVNWHGLLRHNILMVSHCAEAWREQNIYQSSNPITSNHNKIVN